MKWDLEIPEELKELAEKIISKQAQATDQVSFRPNPQNSGGLNGAPPPRGVR